MMWTDERVEMATKLWKGGHSAAAIAAQLACGLTRSAILGKLNRLGLMHAGGMGVASAPTQIVRTALTAAEKEARRRRNQIALRARTSDAAHAPKKQKIGRQVQIREGEVQGKHEPARNYTPPAPEHRVELSGLTNTTCRWPIGDPQTEEFRFCGCPEADLAGGRPYCPTCARIAYQPAKIRESKKDGEAA